jgi:hypothetical protein
VARRLAAVKQAAEGDPLLLGAVPAVSGQGGGAAEAESAVGLSGLSELMRREAAAQAAGKSAKPIATAPASAPAGKGRRRFSGVSPRRLSVWCVGVVLVSSLLGAGWWAVRHTGSADGSQVMIDPADPLPVVTAEVLKAEDWQRIDEPFTARPVVPSVVRVEDASLLTPGPDDGEARVYVSVASNPALLVTAARLTLSLVDDAEVEVARTVVPVALLDYSRRRRVDVRIPSEMLAENLRLVSSVKVEQTITDAVFFAEPGMTAVSSGRHTLMRVRTHNPLDKPVERVVFLIVALDSADRTLAGWRVNWVQRVGPFEPVEFYASLAVDPHMEIDRWTIEAAGR